MNTLAWGLDVVRLFQTVESEPLTFVMKAVTFLGSEYAYLALLPLLYWCVDERQAFRLAVVFFLSAWLNGVLKDLWRQPRPYDLDPAVGMAHETSYGFPSGHAQGTASFWGVFGSLLRGPIGPAAAVAVAVAVPLVVGLSRIYLGVHFPTDVAAGWVIGAGIVGLYYAAAGRVERFFAARNIRVKILALTALVFILNAILPRDVSYGGSLFGMGAGYLMMTARFPFSAAKAADGSPATGGLRLLRFAIGFVGVAVIYFGLKVAFPGSAAPYYALFRFLRYGLIGFWTAALAPALFLRLKLAGTR